MGASHARSSLEQGAGADRDGTMDGSDVCGVWTWCTWMGRMWPMKVASPDLVASLGSRVSWVRDGFIVSQGASLFSRGQEWVKTGVVF